jgi:hypothetical protein
MQAVLQSHVGLLDLAGLEPDRPGDPVDGPQLAMIAPSIREIA